MHSLSSFVLWIVAAVASSTSLVVSAFLLHGRPYPVRGVSNTSPRCEVFLFSFSFAGDAAADVDDCSQGHSELSGSNSTSTTSSTTTVKSGYRPIEEWHQEATSNIPPGKFALENLKREKLRWAKKFQALS